MSPSADSRSINVYRFRFDAAASTPGSNDPIGTSGGVSELLRGVGAYPVSHFVFSSLIVVETLDLELSRFDLHPAASMLGSNDPIGTFRVVSAWLCDSRAPQVSRFDL